MDKKSPCAFCESCNSVTLYATYALNLKTYNVEKCNLCKAYFITPRPNKQELAAAYAEDYYGEGEEKFKGLTEKILDYFRVRRAKKIAALLPLQANVLDIGCGNGRFLLSLLKYKKLNLFGVELPGNSANRTARIKEINLKIGVLEKNDFAPQSVDAISLVHVFEHLTEPKLTLDIISTIIKPDGILYISFPNIDSWQAKFFKGKWLHLDPPRHLLHFAPHDFIALLKNYGFQLEEKNFFNPEQNPFGMTQSILNCFQKKREILFESMKGNKQYYKEYSFINIFCQKLFFLLSSPLFIIFDIIDSSFGKGATVEFIFRKKHG